MNMTRRETDFYLDILTSFRTIPQLLTIIKVSRPTLQRWIDKDTTPMGKYRKYFQKALDQLTTDLINKGGAREEIGRFIEGMPEPEPEAHEYRLSTKRQAIQALLGEYLADGKEHRSSTILAQLKDRGYSRINVQIAANLMGVKKNHIGLGRNSYSLWSLS